MAFSFKVRFAGLCHYIRNSRPQGRVRMCVALPTAPNHVARIKPYGGTIIKRVSSHTTVSEIRLQRHRVDFQLTGGTAGVDFEFYETDDAFDRLAVIGLKHIVPSVARNDPSVVAADPPPEVQAQVLLANGPLSADSKSHTWRWRLQRNVFKEGEQIVKVAYKTAWNLYLDSARMNVVAFGGGSDVYDLIPGGDGVLLEVSNDCESDGVLDIDHDFRFHYNFLHPNDRRIRDSLSDLERERTLPVLVDSLDDIKATLEAGQEANAKMGQAGKAAALKDEVERIAFKILSGGGSGTGCNCLGCGGGTLPIPDF